MVHKTTLTTRPAATRRGLAVQPPNALTHPANVQAADLIRFYRQEGLTYETSASHLNRMGFATRRGKSFRPLSMHRLDRSQK